MTRAGTLIKDLGPATVISDKGYDADAFVALIRAANAAAVSPPRRNRTEQSDYDRHQYKGLNLEEDTSAGSSSFVALLRAMKNMLANSLPCLISCVHTLGWLN
jgi:hypothetical protein